MGDRTEAMTLRLPPEVKAALKATAERTHKSMQQVAIDAITDATTGRSRRVEAAARRIVERDRAVLDRLA